MDEFDFTFEDVCNAVGLDVAAASQAVRAQEMRGQAITRSIGGVSPAQEGNGMFEYLPYGGTVRKEVRDQACAWVKRYLPRCELVQWYNGMILINAVTMFGEQQARIFADLARGAIKSAGGGDVEPLGFRFNATLVNYAKPPL